MRTAICPHPAPRSGYDGKLQIGILPVSLFCSGHTLFVQDMPAKHDLEPYVAHATFQFSGTPGKRNRFRERLMWNDPPEYFKVSRRRRRRRRTRWSVRVGGQGRRGCARVMALRCMMG